jgi:hypothetical protein
MEPVGGKTTQEVRELMTRQVGECLTLLSDIEKGIGTLHTVRMSVDALGRLDMYQWLYFLGQHAKRHLAQMKACLDEKNGGQ